MKKRGFSSMIASVLHLIGGMKSDGKSNLTSEKISKPALNF